MGNNCDFVCNIAASNKTAHLLNRKYFNVICLIGFSSSSFFSFIFFHFPALCVCVCVFFCISLLLPQPQPGTAPVLGRNPTPPLLINLPTDCQGLLAVHRRGGGGGREACLQQLSNKLTTIKTLMQHSITEQRLDCPHFVWHAWWCNSHAVGTSS